MDVTNRRLRSLQEDKSPLRVTHRAKNEYPTARPSFLSCSTFNIDVSYDRLNLTEFSWPPFVTKINLTVSDFGLRRLNPVVLGSF